MFAASPSDSAAPLLAVAGRFRGHRAWLEWLAFFLTVAGVRLVLVAQFGSAMPIGDQWDDEGWRIFKSYLDGTLGLAEFFAPHNEHRHVLARVLALTSLVTNGQWDARLQMTLNVGVATLLALVVAWVGVGVVGQKHRSAVFVAVACWLCLPYAWENTTWAFQSSFYFLVLFSLVAIHGLLKHPPLSPGWMLGVAAALLACISTASGFLAAAPVLAVLALRSLTKRAVRDSLMTGAVCIAIVAVGLAFRVHVVDHDPLRAKSIAEFIGVLARSMAWPFVHHAAVSLLIYAPVGFLLIRYLRAKAAAPLFCTNTGAETLVAMGGWVALQAAAIAYARGGGIGPHVMASRYMDILALGTLVNFFALLGISSRRSKAMRGGGFAAVVAGGWTAAVFLGALSLGGTGFIEMRARAEQVKQAEQHVRAYLVTGDAGQLSAPAAWFAYPWANRLEGLLKEPKIRQILPAVIRRPLPIEPDGSSGPFSPENDAAGRRVWSSQPSGASQSGGEMRSQVLRSSLPYLLVELRGRLGKNMSLKLRDEATGRQRGVEFARSRAEWRAGYAAVRGDFRLIARDEDAERAIAFTEPREVGRLSYYAEGVLDRSLYILVAGIAIAVALAMHSYLLRARSDLPQP